MFEVKFASRTEKQFGKLSQDLRQKFYSELRKLSENPFSHPQVRKIEGAEFGYRLRVGNWRILFAILKKEKRIEVVDIFLKKGKKDYQKRRYLFK